MIQKQAYKGLEIFLRRNWLMQLWRLTSPRICRVSQPAGGPGDLICSSSPVTHRLKAQEEPMLPLKTGWQGKKMFYLQGQSGRGNSHLIKGWLAAGVQPQLDPGYLQGDSVSN